VREVVGGAQTERVRAAVVDGRGPQVGADHPDRAQPGADDTWSLAKLREHLVCEGIVAELSPETLRRILHAGGVSW